MDYNHFSDYLLHIVVQIEIRKLQQLQEKNRGENANKRLALKCFALRGDAMHPETGFEKNKSFLDKDQHQFEAC